MSDGEGVEADDQQDGDNKNKFNLPGFMFGNVNQQGELEEFGGDDEGRRRIGELERCDIGEFKQNLDVQHLQNTEDVSSMENNSTYDYDIESSPSILSETSDDTRLLRDAAGKHEESLDDEDNYDVEEEHEEQPPDKTRPMRHLCPTEYLHTNIKDLFPDYDPQGTPRWSRLFKPSFLPNIFTKGAPQELDLPASHTCAYINLNGLIMGRPAFPDEVAEDTIIRQRRLKDCSAVCPTNRVSSNLNGKSNRLAAGWRHGPAELWYDLLGVPENCDVSNFPLHHTQSTSSGVQEVDTVKCEAKLDLDIFLDLPPMPVTQFNVISDGIGSCADSKRASMIVGSGSPPVEERKPPAEAFLMCNQIRWENDVIWDGESSQSKIVATNQQRASFAAWIPSGNARTLTQFQELNHDCIPGILSPVMNMRPENWRGIFPVDNRDLRYELWEDRVIWDNTEYNTLGEPYELVMDRNDEHLILDLPLDNSSSDNRTRSEEREAAQRQREAAERSNEELRREKETQRRARHILGKAGIIREEESEEEEKLVAEDEEPSIVELHRDPFNLSNDEYYYPKLVSAMSRGTCLGLLHHSTPAVELRPPYFPPHFGLTRLRNFHRPSLKRYSRGPVSNYDQQHPVHSLLKHLTKKARQREEERAACGGGEIFFMRTPADLSGMDGDLVFCEYSEEFPPLMMQVGMTTKIKNYFKRPVGTECAPPELSFGELAYIHQSPFLGHIRPGHYIQALENNMFRAPIYPHIMPKSDVLVIRNRQGYYIRRVNDIFTAGQTCTLMEVPGPNSKKANNFVRDFLQVHIYRMFWQSTDEPRRIKMEEIRRLFPSHSESSVRKRLKLCADFKRTGVDASWWVLRSDFRLPSEEEIRAMISPEECCAYYSMLSAEQRLKDAGYGEKYLFMPEPEDEEESEECGVKMDDEIKAAPWNTSHAFLCAMRGKCILELTGVADPTGCGEGFSYVKQPVKPSGSAATAAGQQDTPIKRTVTGTDADLRRLQLGAARNILRNHGVSAESLKNMRRWEIINLVRTVSTEQLKSGSGESEGMAKFARGSRMTLAEHAEKYREECQRLFDLQNKVLASDEILSTDEASSSEDDDEYEEMRKGIESVLSKKKSAAEWSAEREERVRRDLQRDVERGTNLVKNPAAAVSSASVSSMAAPIAAKNNCSQHGKRAAAAAEAATALQNAGVSGQRRVLRITRTFVSEDGRQYTRTEVVRTAAVVDIYLRIRTTQSEEFIRQFAGSDEQHREEMRKEKRRLQDQLRRIKKMENKPGHGGGGGGDRMSAGSGRSYERDNANERYSSTYYGGGNSSTENNSNAANSQSSKRKPNKPLSAAQSKMRCGACGQVGHMRTNKECPMYQAGSGRAGRPTKDKRTLMQLIAEERVSGATNMDDNVDAEDPLDRLDDDGLTALQGTKLKMSGKLMEYAEEQRRNSLKMKIPMAIVERFKKRKKPHGQGGADYLDKPLKSVHRRRVDPLVALTSIFESIVLKMRTLPGSKAFSQPVKERDCPHYHEVVQRPMDLSTMKQRLQKKCYHTREAFLQDVNLIFENSSLYNGPHTELTEVAGNMLELCAKELHVKEDKLIRLEKAINPLLDDDDYNALGFVFRMVVDRMRSVEGSWPFHNPVDGKRWKDYYVRIRRPMDLASLEKQITERRYRCREEFLLDCELLVENCIEYNKEESPLTAVARRMVEAARDCINDQRDVLDSIEAGLAAEEVSVTGGDTDSLANRSGLADLGSMWGEIEPEPDSGDETLMHHREAGSNAAADLQLSDDSEGELLAAATSANSSQIESNVPTANEASLKDSNLHDDLALSDDSSSSDESNIAAIRASITCDTDFHQPASKRLKLDDGKSTNPVLFYVGGDEDS